MLTSWIDGRYLPHRRARVSVDDRAFLFADAVYEVVAVYDGKFIDARLHMERLANSLDGLRIAPPMTSRALSLVARELLRRNRLRHGYLYLQITRGSAPRWHGFPNPPVRATVFMSVTHKPAPGESPARADDVVSMPDERWQRCDLKTTSLLANCLAMQDAIDAGGSSPWLVAEDGTVREGASSNAWIVTRDGVLVTHPLCRNILGGCTRGRILRLARELQLRVEERGFSRDEAGGAAEAFISSSTSFVRPVVSLDGEVIGDGGAGEVSLRLYEAFIDSLRRGDDLTSGLDDNDIRH